MSLLRQKSLVYSGRQNNLFSRARTLSVNRAASLLKRTRPTIYEWIDQRILIPFDSEPQGNGMNHWFENAYIEAIAKILPPKKPGGHVLDDNLKAAINGINVKFGKTKR